MTARYLLFSLLFAATCFLSCDEEGWFTNCNDCLAEEPSVAEISAKLIQNSPSTSIITIRVYEGDLENNVLIGTYETYGDTFTLEVTINKKYTLTASYNYYGVSYLAVDAVTPRVKYDKTTCEEPCYYIYDTSLNLRVRRP